MKPIKLSTAGTGTTDHLAAVLLKAKTGLQFDLVPFDSTADQMTALLGNKVAVMMDAVSTSGVRDDIRPLLILSDERQPVMPERADDQGSRLPWRFHAVRAGAGGASRAGREPAEDPGRCHRQGHQGSGVPGQAEGTEGHRRPSRTGAEFKAYVEGLYAMVRELKPLMDADINK